MNPPASSRRADLDAAKGILNSSIVLGHNYFFSRYSGTEFALLYNFHVASLLLFPLLFRYDRMNAATYRAQLFRTLVPKGAFLIVTIPLYYAIFVAHRPGEGANGSSCLLRRCCCRQKRSWKP